MPARYPLPKLWLLTDERQGEMLWPALHKLKAGSGVIVRHYSLAVFERRQLFERVRKIARKRRLILVLAGTKKSARAWKADGRYARPRDLAVKSLLCIATVHSLAEIRQAERRDADLALLSPLFPSRSHPGGRPLGTTRFAALAHNTKLPVIALGGVKSKHRHQLSRIGAYGWAGIDAHIGIAAKQSHLRT